MNLSPKQAEYLALVQTAETQNKSICQIAKEHNLRPGTLYGAMNRLRATGQLPDKLKKTTGFAKVPLTATKPVQDDHIELKTQLPNGQPIWMAIPAAQIALVIKSLSA